MQQCLLPLIKQINDIVTQKKYLQDTSDKPFYLTLLTNQICAVAWFSKGLRITVESRTAFKPILETVLRAYSAVPSSQILREAVSLIFDRCLLSKLHMSYRQFDFSE